MALWVKLGARSGSGRASGLGTLNASFCYTDWVAGGLGAVWFHGGKRIISGRRTEREELSELVISVCSATPLQALS